MPLFNRKKASASDDNDSTEQKKDKAGWRRPANTAFKQQRLKAWQPILTPKTVLPTLFLIGLIFAPIGGLLIWGSSRVSEFTIDYTDCETLSAATSLDSLQFTPMPSSKYSYHLSSSDSNAKPNPPQYALLDNSGNAAVTDPSQQRECVVEFHVPATLQPSVLFYYKLTNFYQNHRRYVKSLNADQLKGKFVSTSTLDNSDCKPLSTINGVAIYPCGLIANSLFNDTFSNPELRNPAGGETTTEVYPLSAEGIAWPGERDKYVADPVPTPYANYSLIVPPPNWALRYPNGYTEQNPPPNLHTDERFQNWMRTAGLPTFTKLYGRNDDKAMVTGTYRIVIGLNFPVRPYKGTKSFVFSTVTWIGGKNPFLGWAYVAAAGVFVLLAVLGTVRHVIKPRRLGDMSLLSWNR